MADRFGLLVGRSPGMQRVFELLSRAADSDSTVLLSGETGTGKSRAAESIHRESHRRDDPFVIIDCASACDPLLTPAGSGTLFLDHVAELPAQTQARLARSLEHDEVKPMRLIAASHRDLRSEVRARRFRVDLFYRLAVLEIRMPALDQRLEDLPLLVADLAAKHGGGARWLEAALADGELAHQRWPGNVRELENQLHRLLTLGER